MEFGIFVQGYAPGELAHTTEGEHAAIMNEIEYTRVADQNNWKYVWVTEHHALTEYSHISANDVFLGHLAALTERIHVSSGIFNLSPRANHPVRNVERAAMLDHLSNRRFEFGTGRGAGSHEVATFNIHDTSSTKAEWDEVAPQLFRMFKEKDYTFQGEHFQIDTPHNILPKPYKGTHPPMWVACGNPATYAKAGALGLGALGFNFSAVHQMQAQVDSYKEAAAKCTEPLGDYQNDNVMITNAVICMADREKAIDAACRPDRGYLTSLVGLYHDTFPKPPGFPVWPEKPMQMDRALAEKAMENGDMLCGTPEDICEQLEKGYTKVGFDQLVFGMPNHLNKEETIECLELFGKQVIPNFDKDPVHRSTRFREEAEEKLAAA
jgi:alkanesulfonate monooxygenase SsuD/methylene tetrahydromethanopterin reductase-like flavin-dependent oxidoreductase (luciferase family)